MTWKQLLEYSRLIAIWWGIGFVIRLISASGRSAVRAMQGKGSFSDNMNAAMGGMGEMEARQERFMAGENGEGPEGIGIEIKGLLPLTRAAKIGFVTSVLDMTDENNPEPVLSELEVFQEPATTAYMFTQPVGIMEPNQGFISFVRVGVVFPELLYPGHSGRRKLAFVLRMIDMDNPPPINLGFSDSNYHPGLLAVKRLDFNFNYTGKGYLEAAVHRDEARALAIHLGMAIAVADGSLDTSEGNIIKEWVMKTIAPYGEERREELKEKYNNAMREAYADAKNGGLSLSKITAKLNEIADEPQKYEAIELCFDVMAADGVADESEMEAIRRIAEKLNLDYKEIENLRDKKLVSLNVSADNQASMETILGIESDWTADRIKTHIRVEYAKWNDRLNNLPEGQERENAQQMLELLSEARKKYA